MFPSQCVLERRVRSDRDEDLIDSNLRLFILECKDRKAEGYAADKIEIYNERIKDMKIGVRLADKPPALSYLAILGGHLLAQIVAVNKTVIVIMLMFPGDGGRMSYLIYDAVALSLHMIPMPEDPSWNYTLTSSVSIARRGSNRNGDDYALVLTGMLRLDGVDSDCLSLWRPSLSSRPWLESKGSNFPALVVNDTDTLFSFSGSAYWVDLLCGVSYCSCDALFDDNTGLVEFGFIPLPVEKGAHYRCNRRVAHPLAYRTMGVAGESIRFVSIDGFQNHVMLECRTVTVWKLLDPNQDKPWELEHKFSLQTMWGFEGFGNLPKDLTPMYPLLSTKDMDVVYLVLGEYYENRYKGKFIPNKACYLLAVNMRKKIVTSVRLARSTPGPFISCVFNRRLCKALVGPCDDEGIPMKKEGAEKDLTEPPIPTKKRGRSLRASH